MKSTNFEFLRIAGHEKLANDAAMIERLIYQHEDAALRELCSFAEKLLKVFVIATQGRLPKQSRDKGGFKDDPGFRWLLNNVRLPHKPTDWRSQFGQFLDAGNPLKHQVNASTTFKADALLEVAWKLSCLVGTEVHWQTIPIEFDKPPERSAEHQEVVEALFRASTAERSRKEAETRTIELEKQFEEANRSCDVSGWICDDQRNLSAPKDFVGREFAFSKINQFLADRVCRVLLIQGKPGFGKTAVIKTFVSREIRAENPPLVYCFEDLSSQGEAKRWIQHLYASVVQQWQLAKDDRFIKNPNEDLVQRLRNRIAEVAKLHPNGRMLFVIDAVDEAGPAKQAVVSFLRSEFPSNVQVIVTARRGYVPYSSTDLDGQGSIQVFDLDGPDGLIGRQSDARRYVELKLKRKGLADEMINDIVRLSDGNGLFFEGICRELQDVPTANVTHHLRVLGEFKDLRTALYERTWQRLERLTADELRAVEKVAALLAVAHTPLSERTIKTTLGFDRADWVKVHQHFHEYLDESQRHPPFSAGWIDTNGLENADANIKPVPVFSLFHQTLKDFVRQHLDEDNLADSKKQLADYCLEQLKKRKPSYEYAYALRFAVQHLIEAERWTELIELLTDLDFIEARFASGQGYDLLEDYELAQGKHPDSRDPLCRRDEQDDKLQNWVKSMVEYSRQCTDTRGGYASNEITDALEQIKNLRFPDPTDQIDMSATIKDMKAAEARSQRRRRSSDAAVSLFEFRAFIRSQFDDLNEVPRATFGIAKSFAAEGAVAEAVRRVEANPPTAPILRRTVPRPYQRDQSMVVTRIDCRIDRDEAFLQWMTPDARLGVGYSEQRGSDRIWNLRTGRELSDDRNPCDILAVTPDGRYVATYVAGIEDRRIELIDLRSGNVKEVAIDAKDFDEGNGPWFVASPYGITPDGSLLIFRSGDELVIWNTESKDLSNRIHLGDLAAEEFWCFSHRRLTVCSSGCVAAICHQRDTEPAYWTFFDLLERQHIETVPDSELSAFLEQQWFRDDFLVALSLNLGETTADGRLRFAVEKDKASLKIREQRIEHSNGSVIRRFDASFPFGELQHISADGRYAIASWGDCYLIELANGVWTAPEPADTPPDATDKIDASAPDLATDDHSKSSEWFPDEVLLGAELKLAIQETPEDWRRYYQRVADDKSYRELCENDGGETEGVETADGDAACEFPEVSSDKLVTMKFPLPPRPAEYLAFLPARYAKPTDHFWISHAPGCVLLSPDGSYLFSDHRSTSQSEDKVAVSEPHDAGFDADSEEPQVPKVIAATATNLSNGKPCEIEGPRRMLTVTRDGACVVFTGDSVRPADCCGDRLTFWGIDRKNWLPTDKEYAPDFQFDARHESRLIGGSHPPLHPRVLQSPDGRVLLLPGAEFGGEFILVRLNTGDPKVLTQRRWKIETPWSWFTPDGKFLVQLYATTAYLWTVPDGECIGVVERPELKETDLRVPEWIDCTGILLDERGRDTGIRIDDPQRGPAWVTGARLFRFPDGHGPKLQIADSWEVVKQELPGRYDKNITFLCPILRERVERARLPDEVISTIDRITRHVAKPLVLNLDDEAWDEEGLEFICPACREPHRSTPFYVDLQRSNFNANSDTSR